MGFISNPMLLTLLDSIATGKLIFDNAIGLTGVEANTTAKAAQNDLETLAISTDSNVLGDLMPAFDLRAATLMAPNLYATLGAYGIFWAIDKHLSDSEIVGVTNLDSYLSNQGLRVSQHLQQLGFPFDAAQIMPPATTMASFTVTGSGQGVYTHIQDIDTSQYGRAWVSLVVTSTIGGNAIVATVNGLQIDNQSYTTLAATIPAHSAIGYVVTLGTMGVPAQSYDFLTGVTISGGTVGDAFQVVSLVERVIPTTS